MCNTFTNKMGSALSFQKCRTVNDALQRWVTEVGAQLPHTPKTQDKDLPLPDSQEGKPKYSSGFNKGLWSS
jgi:hypothetical protein